MGRSAERNPARALTEHSGQDGEFGVRRERERETRGNGWIWIWIWNMDMGMSMGTGGYI